MITSTLIKDFDYSKLNSSIIDLLHEKPLFGRVFLGGGSLRTLIDKDDTINDYDIFFKDLYAAYDVMERLEKEQYEKVYSCPLGYLFTYKKDGVKAQIIKEKYYTSLEDLISTFDITACCAATDGINFTYNENFIHDVTSKQIRLNQVSYPVATMKRILKYIQKGYQISSNEIENFIRLTADNEKIDFRHYID